MTNLYLSKSGSLSYAINMKITIDIRLLSRGGETGIPGYTKNLVNELITNREHHFSLFYNGWRKHSVPTEWTNAPNVTIVRKNIPNRLLDLSFRLFNAPRPEQIEGLGDSDLLFSPHFNLLPKTKIPRVITFHDLSFLHYPHFFSSEQKLWHQLQHYKKQAEEAERIIAVSEFTKSDLINLLHIPAEKISVVYSGISNSFHELTTKKGSLLVYQQERNLHQPFILHLGSIDQRKNIQLLIKAFNEVKQNAFFANYQLVLAGRPAFRAKEIFALAKKSPFTKDIRFLKDVSDEERILLYNLAHIFVFPSFFEGFGFPPLEAQACGTPVIASDRTSLPEILGDSVMKINPWNVSQLADSIIAIETNEKIRENVHTAGLKNSKLFTWKKTADETLKIFESVAHQK